MFERTLQDLIRGLRAHKASSKAQEDAFLAEAMGEIREELKGKDMALKAEGVLKMCYLMMLYPIPAPTGFAFHVVEVMSSPRYHLKQLGYLAAPMAFSGDTEEVVLTVNGIKKDMLSPHLPLPPLPLTALPHLLPLSTSLSHTLHPDLLHLLTHSSPRIRKRAILALLPCWEAFPEGLREGFPRLRERLQDDDQGVVGATVGVVMELARRQGGRNYLPLAPELFGILTGSSNNWMLIKVVKLFAILTPLEPRLVRKLLPPITSLISSTSAISLLYECVRTCIVGGMLDPDRPEGEALARVCVEKLGGYLRDEGGDQNLRYIALLAMVKIIPTQPQMLASYQPEILASLDDPDVSIRMRALELVTAMVDRFNLQSIVDTLLSHLSPPTAAPPLPSAAASLTAALASSTSPKEATSATVSLTPAYRLLLAQRLLGMIAHDTYANVMDFEWVVSVLVDVAYVSGVDVGAEVRDVLLDVVGRVRSVRGYAVGVLEKVIRDEDVRERARERRAGGEAGLLEAAIWVCGEYSSDLSSPLSAMTSLLPTSLSLHQANLISLSLLSASKVFATHLASLSSSYSSQVHQETQNVVTSLATGIEPFQSPPDIEVQQRAVELATLLSFVAADLRQHVPIAKPQSVGDRIPGIEGGFGDDTAGEPSYPKSLFLFQPLFTGYELNAVAEQAQAAVAVPSGLDLDREIVPGCGLGGVDDGLEGGKDSDDERGRVDLGEGGGEGMEALRRVLREQDEKEHKEKRDGRKKGKARRKEGEAGMTPEEKEEKAKRKAAKKARAKEDPYYLYDEKDDEREQPTRDEVDVDDIPIVRLDDAELAGPADPPSSEVAQAVKRDPSPRLPPEIDRSGELPPGATSAPVSRPESRGTGGLAAVDLFDGSSRTSSRGRFEEYTVGDEEVRQVDKQGNGDIRVGEGEVEVVKVKRKKKRDKKVVA